MRTARGTVGEHARRLIKSRSMLTEETGLRHCMAAVGVEVVETDLDERIQQLDNEAPSHIVVADAGSVLLTDDALVPNAVAYLAQHLVALLAPDDTWQAYRRPIADRSSSVSAMLTSTPARPPPLTLRAFLSTEHKA